jgi:hypothetical protein
MRRLCVTLATSGLVSLLSIQVQNVSTDFSQTSVALGQGHFVTWELFSSSAPHRQCLDDDRFCQRFMLLPVLKQWATSLATSHH